MSFLVSFFMQSDPASGHRVAAPFPRSVSEKMSPHNRSSGDHRHENLCWVSHTFVGRCNYGPVPMSTKHTRTAENGLKRLSETRLEPGWIQTEKDCRAATIFSCSRVFLEMAANAWNIPNESELNWINCNRQSGDWPVLKRLIFLDFKCLLLCCVSLLWSSI